MEIHLDSDKLIAFLKDVGEVYAMISGELGDEPAVERMLNFKNGLVTLIDETERNEKELETQIAELLALFNETDDQDTLRGEIEEKVLDFTSDDGCNTLNQGMEDCIRTLIEGMGYEEAKKFVDAEGRSGD